jgi:quinol monooxygenase YgiN
METPMPYCNEFAVFEVPQANQAEIITLSLRLFEEMNAKEQMLISYQILRKTDNAEQICWHLVWKDETAVAQSKAQWSSYPSAKSIESLVSAKIFYGHFIDVITSN